MDFDISVRTIVTIALKGLEEFSVRKKRDPDDHQGVETAVKDKPTDKLPPVENT